MTTPAYRRHDISDHVWELLEPPSAWSQRYLGWSCPGQSAVHQCRVLDSEEGCALAGSAAGLWGLEEPIFRPCKRRV